MTGCEATQGNDTAGGKINVYQTEKLRQAAPRAPPESP